MGGTRGWGSHITSLLFRYDLLGFIDWSKLCLPTMITLLNATSPSLNLDHILCLIQDQLILNAIVGFATFHATWTTLEKMYVSHSCGQIITHSQNLAISHQGNRTFTDYIQDVKHNIDSLTLMNVFIDFDELSIRVLNGLGPAYSHISHVLQAQDTPIMDKNFSIVEILTIYRLSNCFETSEILAIFQLYRRYFCIYRQFFRFFWKYPNILPKMSTCLENLENFVNCG